MFIKLFCFLLCLVLGLTTLVKGTEVAHGKRKNAIMTIHYEGTKKDDEYVLAIRVLMKSVQISGTNADLVVVASKNIRKSTKDKFSKDGLQVRYIDNIENPFHSKEKKKDNYMAHFEFTLNKLLLWSFEEYERVIYFDADNIVLNNLEEVFKCGHFCAVYMNPIYFHTGMLVIKPNKTVFDDMMLKLAEGMESYDGADQGFLTEYFAGMDDAHLFRPENGVSEDRMNRLSIGFNIHHMYYYEKMNWKLYERGAFKQLPSTIPAYSLGYPILPPLKPWYWWNYLLLDNHWEFYRVRKLLHENWTFSFIWRLMAIAFIGLSTQLIHPLLSQNSIVLKWTDLTHFIIGKWGGSLCGSCLGVVCCLLSCYMAGSLVPGLTPPPLAWTLFVLQQNVYCYAFLRFFGLLCLRGKMYSNILRTTLPNILLQGFIVYISTAKIYSNPVTKVVLCIMLLLLSLSIELRMFRNIAKSVGVSVEALPRRANLD